MKVRYYKAIYTNELLYKVEDNKICFVNPRRLVNNRYNWKKSFVSLSHIDDYLIELTPQEIFLKML